jgi:hypothetical protein
MNQTLELTTEPTMESIVALAARLKERFGMDITVSHSTGAHPWMVWGGKWRAMGETPTFGDHAAGHGATPEEAADLFIAAREELAAIDPLSELKKQAEAAGMVLVKRKEATP